MRQQEELELLKAFHLMDEEEKSLHLEAFQMLTEGRAAKQRRMMPALRLVASKTTTN